MIYENGSCDQCGNQAKVVKSSNKLAKHLCASCIVNSIDVEKSNDVRKLSLTLEMPFDLNEYYVTKLGILDDVEAMDAYLEHLSGGKFSDNHSMIPYTEIDNHFANARSFAHTLSQIEPLKNSLIARGAAKWGEGFSFQELINLESLYENTIRQFGISTALQKDAIKKAVKISISIDSLIAAGDFKSAVEAQKAYSGFLKTADIDTLIEVSNDDTIRTVSDLAKFLEDNGYEFNRLLPDVPKDEIDKLMDNYVENTKEIVFNHTGLDVQIREMIEKLESNIEEGKAMEAAEAMILEDDIDLDYYDVEEQKFINELTHEEVDDDDFNDIF